MITLNFSLQQTTQGCFRLEMPNSAPFLLNPEAAAYCQTTLQQALQPLERRYNKEKTEWENNINATLNNFSSKESQIADELAALQARLNPLVEKRTELDYVNKQIASLIAEIQKAQFTNLSAPNAKVFASKGELLFSYTQKRDALQGACVDQSVIDQLSHEIAAKQKELEAIKKAYDEFQAKFANEKKKRSAIVIPPELDDLKAGVKSLQYFSELAQKVEASKKRKSPEKKPNPPTPNKLEHPSKRQKLSNEPANDGENGFDDDDAPMPQANSYAGSGAGSGAGAGATPPRTHRKPIPENWGNTTFQVSIPGCHAANGAGAGSGAGHVSDSDSDDDEMTPVAMNQGFAFPAKEIFNGSPLHKLLAAEKMPTRREFKKFLKDNKGKIDLNSRVQNWTALHVLAARGKYHHMGVLLEMGADATLTLNGWNLFHLLAYFPDMNRKRTDVELGTLCGVLKDKLGKGAINALTPSGSAAVHLAAYLPRNQWLYALLFKDANPNLLDKEGFAPIHHAIRCENGLERVNLLFESERMSPTLKTPSGKNPLMLAVEGKKVDIVKRLLLDPRVTAEIYVTDKTGSTVQDYAIKNIGTPEGDEILKALEQFAPARGRSSRNKSISVLNYDLI